ncbi:hypothetical protein IAT38_002527 [Cryptococcus sp. DSM 104549]
MTTLIEIPNTSVFHVPTPTSKPLPLSEGDLTLTLIPADPPTNPAPTVTLTVGASSFPLLANAPVQRVQSKEEHPSYAFFPKPPKGGTAVGQVRIKLKDSKSQGEWEATEALALKFEELLKENKLWDEKQLFVNDEYETGGEAPKGWGEAFAGTVVSAGHSLANRLSAYTDRHVAQTDPEQPAPPSATTANAARSLNLNTASVASAADSGATYVGESVHSGGATAGSYLPDSIAQPAQPVAQKDKSEFRKFAEDGWEQVSFAAKGVASAATTVGGALSGNSHKAVGHNFGPEADGVAQDIGQTGANIGSTGVSAFKATSVAVQGTNAATGAATGHPPPKTLEE